MNDRHPVGKYVLAALPLILLSVLNVFAQGGPPGGPPPTNRTNAERLRQQDMSRREYQLRNFGKEPGAPKDSRQVEALMAQTEDDFNRIRLRAVDDGFRRLNGAGVGFKLFLVEHSTGKVAGSDDGARGSQVHANRDRISGAKRQQYGRSAAG